MIVQGLFCVIQKYIRILPDPPKRLANLDKHKLDMRDLTPEFFETSIIMPTHDARRFMAVGYFGGQAVTVIFSLLGTEAIAPISMRPASKKERNLL